MAKYVIKSSGEKEKFNLEKFKRSLRRSGASQKLIEQLAQEVQDHPKLKTTQQIYYYALEKLKHIYRPVAARYSLKHAFSQLGPSGFPFEAFIAQIFLNQSYTTTTGAFVTGFCVDHEIDVVAHKGKKHLMIEVKFHTRTNLKSDLKVTLYVRARFEDIKKQLEKDPAHAQEFQEVWLVTNTKFTTEAVRYATCTNIQLLGWSYPARNNLAELVDNMGLHPITCLTSLKQSHIKTLIKKGFVLCKDVGKNIQHLKKLGLSSTHIKEVLREAEGVCAL